MGSTWSVNCELVFPTGRYFRGVWLFWPSRDRTICLLHLPSGHGFHVRTFQCTIGGGDCCFGSFFGVCLRYASMCHHVIESCTFIPSVYPSTVLYNGSIWKVLGSNVGRDAWYLEWYFLWFSVVCSGEYQICFELLFPCIPISFNAMKSMHLK